MDKLTRKSITTSRSLEYSYYTTEPTAASAGKPALLFTHGWPDSAHLWNDIIAQLQSLPYRIVAPDLLGYGDTSKPTDPALYAYSLIAQDLQEILQAEDISSVVVIGHDWGAAMAQRFYLHKRNMVVGVVSLNVAYLVPNPSQKFDLDAVNQISEKAYGYPLYPYWELFTAEDGPALVNKNLDRMYEAMHGDPKDWMRTLFCNYGAMKEYITGQRERVPLKKYAHEERWKKDFFGRFERDGFEAPFCWYKAMKNNIQDEDDAKIPDGNYKIEVPVLFIGATGDAVCRIDIIEAGKKQGLLPDLEEKVIESGHWSPMEKPEEIATLMKDFLGRRFA
ncbi:epoxide hydrolase [Corynespora cassiicola Philippines]|uniref:Epoxide hydrolase n=1 Tax=Corynespora cassiicola Philippines TaxID=1448308 RepID=A0A2T2N8P7_CORCC|nr:epoxide hydrolase [Corynespora cassiicola Philippines]